MTSRMIQSSASTTHSTRSRCAASRARSSATGSERGASVDGPVGGCGSTSLESGMWAL